MAKVQGYIIPPFDIVDFVPVVYKEGDHSYIANVKEGIITAYDILFEDIPIKSYPIDIIKNEGDSAFYFYMLGTGEMIYGEYEEMFVQLVPLLKSDDINSFAKLSLASFFNLIGRERLLIEEIVNDLDENALGFLGAKIQAQRLDVGEENLISTKFSESEMLIKKTNCLIDYIDIIYFENNFVYFNIYECSIDGFINSILKSNDILKIYFNSLPRKTRQSVILNNKSLCQFFWQHPIEIQLTLKEAKLEMDNIEAVYNIENGIIEESHKSFRNVDSHEGSELCKKMKNKRLEFKEKFETEFLWINN